MGKIILIIGLVTLNQFCFAQDTASSPKSKKIEGCVYADIIYSVGEKHRIQYSVTDPVTNKAKMVDAESEILQECMEDKNAGKTKSPRFYWRTL